MAATATSCLPDREPSLPSVMRASRLVTASTSYDAGIPSTFPDWGRRWSAAPPSGHETRCCFGERFAHVSSHVSWCRAAPRGLGRSRTGRGDISLSDRPAMTATEPSHAASPPPTHERSAGQASPTKREALDLFRGLPRRYDELSAALSFWQDPRWRRALVERGGAGAGGAHPRRRDRHGHGRGGAARARGLHGRRSRPERGDARAAPARGDAPRAPVARRRLACGADRRAGRARCPLPDASFDALTFTYLLRYVDDPPATLRELARVVRPGGRVASLEFGVPPWRRRARRGGCTRRRSAGARTAGLREWARSARSSARASRGFYARHPPAAIVGYWREAGLQDVRVRRMSLGGGIVMSATKSLSPSAAPAPPASPPAPAPAPSSRSQPSSGAHGAAPERPAFYALGRGRLAIAVTLLHPPYTAWHLSYLRSAPRWPRAHVNRLLWALAAFGSPSGSRRTRSTSSTTAPAHGLATARCCAQA